MHYQSIGHSWLYWMRVDDDVKGVHSMSHLDLNGKGFLREAPLQLVERVSELSLSLADDSGG